MTQLWEFNLLCNGGLAPMRRLAIRFFSVRQQSKERSTIIVNNSMPL
jgi:hypothetical protein